MTRIAQPGLVVCQSCGRPRILKEIRTAGLICRRCAAERASARAAVVNSTLTIGKFSESVRITDMCWEWIGHRYSNGYGAIQHDGRQVLAHRWSYEHHVGPIPDGLQIDHLCRNRACVNPAHLEAVTAAENTRRAMRFSCVNGHFFTPENTYTPNDGKRYCRECRRQRNRAQRERRANATK